MKTSILILSLCAWIVSSEKQVMASPPVDPQAALEVPGGSNLIGDWITVHLKVIRSYPIPSNNVRQLGYTGIALYESIVAGDKNYKSLAGQLDAYQPATMLPDTKDICWPSSANTALAKMIRFFYPQNSLGLARVDSLENAWKKHFIDEGYSEASIKTGSEYGSKVAQAVIDWSNTDGGDKVSGPYTLPAGKGFYEPTPPKFLPPILPLLGNCRTLVKGSIENTIPSPPPVFSTESQSPFYKMVDDVYQTSLHLDEGEKATGLFWDDYPDGKTVTTGGHWASILKTILADRRASLMEGAMLYAALFVTENDAAIGCFKAKYAYLQMRPVTYIQKYMNHPDWNPLIVTPPHPEYPAAHAAISMSGATMLTLLLGNKISFTDNTYAYRGYKSHHFNNFTEAAREAGLSRLYGGIHYRSSIEIGYQQGEKIATHIAHALTFKN